MEGVHRTFVEKKEAGLREKCAVGKGRGVRIHDEMNE